MNPSRFDKWPAYEQVRLVLVTREYRYERPWQGLVVDWCHDRHGWKALVTFIDDRAEGTGVRTEWVPAERLRPIRADPNPLRDDWF